MSASAAKHQQEFNKLSHQEAITKCHQLQKELDQARAQASQLRADLKQARVDQVDGKSKEGSNDGQKKGETGQAKNLILSPGLGEEGVITSTQGPVEVGREQDKEQLPMSHLSLVDIGANLTSRDFNRDVEDVIGRARAAGVSAILVTGTSIKESQRASQMAARFGSREGLYSTAGIHPHDAKSFQGEASTAELRALLAKPHVVAVGECGLDYNRNFSTKEQQLGCFEAQVRLACELQMPMFLHEREAHTDFVEVLSRFEGRLPPLVVHCFTGGATEVDVYIAKGWFIGLTGTICMGERGKGLREMVKAKRIPLERLMLETDAPFMHPCPKKEKKGGGGGGRPRCEPCHLVHVAHEVSQCLGVPVEQVCKFTTQNAVNFFRLPDAASVCKTPASAKKQSVVATAGGGQNIILEGGKKQAETQEENMVNFPDNKEDEKKKKPKKSRLQ